MRRLIVHLADCRLGGKGCASPTIHFHCGVDRQSTLEFLDQLVSACVRM